MWSGGYLLVQKIETSQRPNPSSNMKVCAVVFPPLLNAHRVVLPVRRVNSCGVGFYIHPFRSQICYTYFQGHFSAQRQSMYILILLHEKSSFGVEGDRSSCFSLDNKWRTIFRHTYVVPARFHWVANVPEVRNCLPEIFKGTTIEDIWLHHVFDHQEICIAIHWCYEAVPGVILRSNNSSIGSYYQLEMCLKTSVHEAIEDCVQRVRQPSGDEFNCWF